MNTNTYSSRASKDFLLGREALERASNWATKPSLLELLSTNDDPFVRRDVAENPSTAGATLLEMAEREEEEEEVLLALARHPNLPTEAIALLALRAGQGVQCALAERADLSPESILWLRALSREEGNSRALQILRERTRG